MHGQSKHKAIAASVCEVETQWGIKKKPLSDDGCTVDNCCPKHTKKFYSDSCYLFTSHWCHFVPRSSCVTSPASTFSWCLQPYAAALITFKMESSTAFQMQVTDTVLSDPICKDPQNNCQGCKLDSTHWSLHHKTKAWQFRRQHLCLCSPALKHLQKQK